MISGINSASQMASQLFAKLDTKKQGYFDKSDLSTAFSQIAADASSSSTSSSSVDDVFSALDSNSDGKVTKDEFSNVLAQLQGQMDSQRMSGAHGGPHGAGGRPPPPPADDAGLTKDELTSQISAAGSTDSERTNLMSKVANNFEAADTNSDGKVSFKEAMAYDKSTEKTASTTSSSGSNSEASVMMKIMQLMHAYGNSDAQSQSGLSISA